MPIVWYSLSFTNYQGDLTRIGKWPESLFSPQIPPSNISSNLLVSNAISEADILVIGDSFSEHLQWQSLYQKDNTKVATLLWSDIQYICEDFTKNIESAGFHGKKIIIESIERVAANQIKKSTQCAEGGKLKNNPHLKTYSKEIFSVDVSQKINLSGQFIAGLQTIFNKFGIQWIANYSEFHNYFTLASVRENCTVSP